MTETTNKAPITKFGKLLQTNQLAKIGEILVLGGVYIVSSFGEEVIYRAFLINRISELGKETKKASIIAVILSSIIFGLIHYD